MSADKIPPTTERPEGEVNGDLIILSKTTPKPSRANDAVVGGAAIAAAVFALGFALGLTFGLSITWYGSFLALSFFALGFAVRRYFHDRFPAVQAAELREHDNDDDDVPISAVETLPRRPFLTRLLIGAGGLFGVSLLSVLPSLGPRVGDTLKSTAWAPGIRLVTSSGEPIRPGDIAVGGMTTAWPEDNIGFERAAVMVLRLADDPEPPTNMDWVVDGQLVAYSKICTHLGCPVALYRERENTLFCPCHQSTFNVAQACKPVFGPAARSLPQLPLGVEGGYLVALGDFEAHVGPTTG